MDIRLKGHIPALDGVRGIAILLVLLFHTARPEPQSAAERVVALTRDFGWAGVDLFFALSGFLITGILLDARESPGYFRNFFTRRALRIFPLYFAYCTVLFLLVPAANGFASDQDRELLQAAPWYFGYAMNVHLALQGTWDAAIRGTAMFWSLCVEEQFYLLWPFVVYRAGRAKLVPICLAMIVLALGIRFWAVVVMDNVLAAYVLLPSRMDALAAGALVAAVARGPIGLTGLRRMAPWGLTGSALGVACLVVPSAYSSWDAPVMATIGFTLTAIGCASAIVLVLAAEPGRWTARIVGSNMLRFFGKYSYGMYVFGAVSAQLVAALPLHRLIATTYDLPLIAAVGVNFAADLAVTVALAMVSWALLERPFVAMKHRFAYAQARPGLEGAPVAVPDGIATPASVLTEHPPINTRESL